MRLSLSSARVRTLLAGLVIGSGYLAAPPEAFGQG